MKFARNFDFKSNLTPTAYFMLPKSPNPCQSIQFDFRFKLIEDETGLSEESCHLREISLCLEQIHIEDICSRSSGQGNV